MATYTATSYAKEPQRCHAGLNTRVAQIVQTAVANDVIKLFKLPDRAVVVNAGLHRSTAQGDLALGVSGDPDKFCSTLSAAGSASFNAADGLNYQVSLSDDVIVKEQDVIVTVTSATHTGTIKAFIQYVLDERE